eukprot:86386_1
MCDSDIINGIKKSSSQKPSQFQVQPLNIAIRQKNVRPPLSHIIDPRDLQPGDHIYRRLRGWTKYFGFHHGIVTQVPSQDKFWADEILVMELSKQNGIQKTTLPLFLKGEPCRLVYYNTDKLSETLHRAGTCHSEGKSPAQIIIKRCVDLKEELERIDAVYSLVGFNCEDFALFCITGIPSSNIVLTQVKRIMHKVEKGAHCGHKFELCHQEAQHALKHIHKSHMLSHKIQAKLTVGMQHAAQNIVHAGTGCIAFFGVTLGFEAVFSGIRYCRYKYEVNYLWQDLKVEMATGWTNSVLISVSALVIFALGVSFWWLLLAVFGVPALIYLLKKIFFKPKSYKEKMFLERGLKTNATVEEKKLEIKKIVQQIKDEKLHPNSFEGENLSKFQQKQRLKKYMLLWNIKTLLKEDIDNENGLSDDIECSATTRKNVSHTVQF